MKNLFSVLFVGLLALPCAATPITVSNAAATVVLPAIAPTTVAARANETAYTNGAYRSIGDFVFVCLVGGTTDVVAPTVTKGDLTDGTVVWRPVPKVPRKGLALSVNDGTSVIRFDFGALLATNTGVRLPGGVVIFDNPASVPQSEVRVMAESGSCSVSAVEW